MPPRPVLPPMRLQNLEKIVPGVGRPVFRPAMDQDGPLARGGDFELANQPFALHLMRRALVVVVEADLAAGDHLRLGQQAVQLGQNRVVDSGRRVRINACAGIEPRHARLAR